MKTPITIVVLFALLSLFSQCKHISQDKDKITVASYYFPSYHIRDSTQLPISKQADLDGRSEWQLVQEAKPRFEGHQQPKVPAWGYTDEKDPAVMEMKIKTAADYGIDVFIFDWYNYEGKPFLNQCLDQGFLKAKNTDKIKFSLMWANHDWKDLFPSNGVNLNELEVMYKGTVSSKDFDKIGDELIHDYFTKPNYWLIDGRAYFSIYDIRNFIKGFGSMEATRQAMEGLDQKAMAAGLKGIHWNIVATRNPVLPGDKDPTSVADIIESLSFSSACSYVWIHHVRMPDVQTDYNKAREVYFAHWDKAKMEYGVPYFPNVTMGWDSSPRTNQSMVWDHTRGYPYGGVLINNTPANFKDALQKTKDKLLADPNGPRIFNINCWNEWTEGSYLEPDTVNGMAYLEAVKEVFKEI